MHSKNEMRDTTCEIRGLYALCDTSMNPSLDHFELAEKLLAGGVSILQLRMKGEQNLDKIKVVAQKILQLKTQYDFTFILNDHVELALELGVDGVHVGQDDMSLAEIRELAQDQLLIGYSSHSLMEAKQAEIEGADYVALGAIFPTPTKGLGHPVVGINTLKRVVDHLEVPVVAIGGINRENIQEVLSTGVNAVAMISALSCAPDIQEAAEYFSQLFNSDGNR